MRKFAWAEGRGFAGRVCLVVLMTSAISLPGMSAAVGQVATRGAGDGITATGMGVVELDPQRLRLDMWVQAQGKDAKSAVQSLAAHKERVEKDLKEMNADLESIQFSATRLSTGDDQPDEMKAAAQMMRRQMGQPALDTDDLPTIYTAKAALQVEWPLPTKDRDALAILPQGLLDQIESRDFAGEENKPELPEEQQERLEETQAMMQESIGSYSFGSESDSGPKIVFVAAVDRQQRMKATKQAFERARESAELIAEASGIDLGQLQKAAAAPTSANTRAMQYAWNSETESNPFDEVDETHVTASSPDTLEYIVSLTVVYGM